MSNALIMVTPRLRLIAAELAHLRTELDDPAQLGVLLGAEMPATWPPGEYDRGATAYFLSEYERRGSDAVGWYGWYAVRPAHGAGGAQVVGAGGYFGPPSPEGSVEIGYSIAEEWRSRGYGSELALALTDRALRDPRVRRVIAQTAADNAASHVVLRRAGFTCLGAAGESGKWRYVRSAKATA
ncbi:MAG: GNAT family N-acetyltransferase [Casimicrobiaceae bacterium]